jgi:hypothetical protein
MLALRGYDRAEGDMLITTVLAALDSRDVTARSQAAALLHDVVMAFPMRMRGCDRAQVHAYLDDIRAQLQQ